MNDQLRLPTRSVGLKFLLVCILAVLMALLAVMAFAMGLQHELTFIGVGVAGLQAIATAKRLGAIVSATDVRLATKEQVQSLGGTFVMVEDEETKQAETAGGYAKEMSDAYKKKQAALIAETIKKQDIVITTALIPGRPAPVLVTKKLMPPLPPGRPAQAARYALSRGRGPQQ